MTEIWMVDASKTEEVVGFATEVYERSVRASVYSPEQIGQFYEYMNPAALSAEIECGRLFVWEIHEIGKLCGVCAMTVRGHITMLYVAPEARRLGMGSRMLEQMRGYAGRVLGLTALTIHVIPQSAAIFFSRRGFLPDAAAPAQGMASMVCPLLVQREEKREVTYRERPLRQSTVIGWTLGVLFLTTAIVAGAAFFTL